MPVGGDAFIGPQVAVVKECDAWSIVDQDVNQVVTKSGVVAGVRSAGDVGSRETEGSSPEVIDPADVAAGRSQSGGGVVCSPTPSVRHADRQGVEDVWGGVGPQQMGPGLGQFTGVFGGEEL